MAGRALISVIMCSRDAGFESLVGPAREGLESCVGLLRRLSSRLVYGVRAADTIIEYCRSEFVHAVVYTLRLCSSFQHCLTIRISITTCEHYYA
jgi:hypothetical protein